MKKNRQNFYSLIQTWQFFCVRCLVLPFSLYSALVIVVVIWLARTVVSCYFLFCFIYFKIYMFQSLYNFILHRMHNFCLENLRFVVVAALFHLIFCFAFLFFILCVMCLFPTGTILFMNLYFSLCVCNIHGLTKYIPSNFSLITNKYMKKTCESRKNPSKSDENKKMFETKDQRKFIFFPVHCSITWISFSSFILTFIRPVRFVCVCKRRA